MPLAPVIRGGGHERGLRSGTLNTPAIVGFGLAAELASDRRGEAVTIQRLRDRLHLRNRVAVPYRVHAVAQRYVLDI